MTEPEITASDMDGLNTYENKQDRPQSSSLHQVNAWAGPGPAAFDFRSDTITTPTANMLKAIQECTLMDDVFMEDASTNGLEKHIAELTGKLHPTHRRTRPALYALLKGWWAG